MSTGLKAGAACFVVALVAMVPSSGLAAPVQKQPALSVNDVAVTEGNSATAPTTFTVSLSAAAPKSVTVDFSTADGTATAGSDYVPASGTLVFSKGQTTKSMSVEIDGDTTVEADETFFLRLSNAKNATISDGSGQAKILNDDAPPPPNRRLSVTESGSGRGIVTSNPAGIDCGADCSEDYPDGTAVTLTATPSGGSTFAGWSGACSGSGECTVTMDAAKSVTATFTATPVTTYTLTVSCTTAGGMYFAAPCSSEPSGYVSSSPGSINCGTPDGSCSEAFPAGTVVTLTAHSNGVASFFSWSGACNGEPSTCNVLMDGDKSAGATFAF